VSGANGVSDGPNFQRVDGPPPAEGLSAESGLELLRRRKAAAAGAPEPPRQPAREPAREPPPREPPPEHEADDPVEDDREGGGGGDPGQSFELVIDGKPQRVGLPELMQGYLRQSDYSRKTQEVSSQQREAAEAFQQLQRATQELEGKLSRFVTETGQEFAEPVDWARLAREDPFGWAEKRARYDMLREAQEEQQRLQLQRQYQEAAREDEQLRAAGEVLNRALPGWRDPATRAKLQETMKSLLLEVGYTPDVFNRVKDPKELLVLNYAIQGWQMQNKKIAPSPPEPTRPARGGAPAPQAPRRVREAEASFEATRSMRDGFTLAKVLKSQRPPGRR